MNIFTKRILAAVSTSVMLFSLASPVLAETTIEISGNGASSDNDAKVDMTGDTTVVQNNSATISNSVSSSSNTGDNKANQNTGGDVLISTGDADASADVTTTANANWAQVGGNGQTGSLSARILGNGFGSDNDIKLKLDDDTTLVQNNDAYVYNKVDADADTGHNKANQNTGGDVLILTGDATADVSVDNLVNFNWADVNCGCTVDLLAKVAGNGAESDNDIKVKLDNDKSVFQDNLAYLDNYVDADADTGHNKAKQNTGPVGDDPTTIWTGDSWSSTDVSNTGNANSFGVSWPVEWPDFDFSFNLSLNLSQLLALVH